MTEPRKASDILLTLEAEAKLLKTTISLQDRLLKIILDNCNKTNIMLNAFIETLPLEQKTIIINQFQPKEIGPTISIPPGFPIEVEKEFKGQRRNSSTPIASTKASNADIEFKDYIAQRKNSNAPEEFKAPNKTNNKSEKKVPIVQRVQDNNKKDLFMAEVNLTSSVGEFVLKTKTNAMGKWQAQLSPGKYTVNVSKMDTALQKKIVGQQDIVVPNSNNPITLSTLIINRE